MSANDVVINKIDRRFSVESFDLPAMQHSVEAVVRSIEDIVGQAILNGEINKDLLRASLRVLAHASARAQEEFALVRGDDDDMLPNVWTGVAFRT